MSREALSIVHRIIIERFAIETSCHSSQRIFYSKLKLIMSVGPTSRRVIKMSFLREVIISLKLWLTSIWDTWYLMLIRRS